MKTNTNCNYKFATNEMHCYNCPVACVENNKPARCKLEVATLMQSFRDWLAAEIRKQRKYLTRLQIGADLQYLRDLLYCARALRGKP